MPDPKQTSATCLKSFCMLKLNTTPAALMIFGHNKSKRARNFSTWIHCLKPHLSTNPRLNFNMGFFIPLLQSLFQIISILFSGHPIIQLYTKVALLNFLLKLLNLKSDSTLTLDYLYPALKNLAVNYSLRHERFFFFFFSFFFISRVILEQLALWQGSHL